MIINDKHQYFPYLWLHIRIIYHILYKLIFILYILLYSLPYVALHINLNYLVWISCNWFNNQPVNMEVTIPIEFFYSGDLHPSRCKSNAILLASINILIFILEYFIVRLFSINSNYSFIKFAGINDAYYCHQLSSAFRFQHINSLNHYNYCHE